MCFVLMVVGFFFASLCEVHHRLDLAGNILGRTRRHLGLFHQFEQVGLHPATAHIAARHAGRSGNLVDFVNVDNAILRARDITVGKAYELPH